MANTHLEHQIVKFRQNKYGNATTHADDPYTNYSPREGITTALILGESRIHTDMNFVRFFQIFIKN